MKTATARPRRRAGKQGSAIVAHNSQPKLVLLALPCIAAPLVGAFGVITGQSPLGGGIVTHAAAAAIGALTAFTLLQMAFDRKPVLVIDETGISCRRPDVGTIPWSAVVGLGTSRATLLRKVLMIAVDEAELDEKARNHMRNRVGLFSAFSPGVARFEGRMTGRATIHIPISYFDVSLRDLERQIFEKVRYHGR